MNLLEIAELSEEEARQELEKLRWPDSPICPHCGSLESAGKVTGKSVRDGLYWCSACGKQFTVTVGTVMEGTHLTMKQWLMAFHLMCSSKKGVSALQLQRELGLGSYKTAWHLAHRIRLAMNELPLAKLLEGIVEVDETYIGGRPARDPNNKRGRGTEKTPVVALIERDGKAIVQPVKAVDSATLKSIIKLYVSEQARIMTDEWKAYNGLSKDFSSHQTVNHGQREYSRKGVHVNHNEAFFALLKRGLHGIFHHVSDKHLGRYCQEFSFRWNFRFVNDGERCDQVVRQVVNKRLLRRELLKEGKEINGTH